MNYPGAEKHTYHAGSGAKNIEIIDKTTFYMKSAVVSDKWHTVCIMFYRYWNKGRNECVNDTKVFFFMKSLYEEDVLDIFRFGTFIHILLTHILYLKGGR